MKKSRSVPFVALSLLTFGLAACGSGSGGSGGGSAGGGTTTNGSISGTVSPGATKPSSAPAFVAGDIIVKFRSRLQATSATTLQAAGLQLARVRPLGLERVSLYRSNANAAQTLEMVRQLSNRSDVQYAQPNWIKQALAVPTDPQYTEQWHYENMNLPAAWDISTGAASTVVAVIDDGMLYNAATTNAATNDADPKTHPDFAEKVIGGYDFISDAAAAEDGDGRDANAYDNRIGLHGTHVAGTIAAATNNGKFGAGVNWNAKLINARVLGKGGGSTSDIIDATLWSAGIAVTGVPANPNPAKVLNLSLGGAGECSPAEQDSFDQVTAVGVIVVVAAGNENKNVNAPVSPANCNNVITVGATGPTNKRAPYSNFGTRVDVMAPGGDSELSVTRGNKDFEAAIYSTYYDKTTNAFNLGGIQGTSMASPHMAGLVSLMVGLDPTLNYTKTLAFLKNNAAPLSAADCANGNAVVTAANFCGAGLVDAAKTLKAVKDALGGPIVAPPPAPPAPLVVKITKNFVRADNTADSSKSKQVEIALTTTAVNYSLTDLAPGTYVVTAYNDLNGNSERDVGEPKVSTTVTIGSGENKAAVNLTMQPDK